MKLPSPALNGKKSPDWADRLDASISSMIGMSDRLTSEIDGSQLWDW
jgi:hypothetical protein